MKQITADTKHVKHLGRTYLEDGVLWLALSGTGAEFTFCGKELSFSVIGDASAEVADNRENYARIAVYVDGVRVIDDLIDQKEKCYTVFAEASERTATVTLLKLSESAMSVVGIPAFVTDDAATMAPALPKARRIEFIGDSITCGYGVDDEVAEHPFLTATEDVTKAYAYRAAALLDADYSMVSASGYGVVSGYSGDGVRVTDEILPDYYESYGFSGGCFASGKKPHELAWDFSRFVPDVIVINLGTNDDSYCQGDPVRVEEFVTEYRKFLYTVRRCNPLAPIVCTVGIMGERIYAGVEQAVASYREESQDTNVTAFCLKEQDTAVDGVAANWHPTAATHAKAAKAVAERLQALFF